jgi:hypothetical protein
MMRSTDDRIATGCWRSPQECGLARSCPWRRA